MSWPRLIWIALVTAVLAHLAFVYAAPRVMMNVAFDRLSNGGALVNAWRISERITAESRAIVRPSPDFAYAACPYDVSRGPVRIVVAPWQSYWSLSLYADNSDNYFVIDDREARNGVEITLIRAGRTPPDDAVRVVEAPGGRGVALIRRLAPTATEYRAAREIAREDVCAAISG